MDKQELIDDLTKEMVLFTDDEWYESLTENEAEEMSTIAVEHMKKRYAPLVEANFELLKQSNISSAENETTTGKQFSENLDNYHKALLTVIAETRALTGEPK